MLFLLPPTAVKGGEVNFMDRRNFLKTGTVAAGVAASHRLLDPLTAGAATKADFPQRVLGKTGEKLSIIGFGGIVVMNAEQSVADRTVAEAFDRGINYFDVAPSYGNAEEKLGPALEPWRKKVFLACKTGKRDKAGAAEELENSLRRMRTDHFDLYQLHAMTKMEDVAKVLGPDGALEAFVAAQKAGKIRYIGFSAHSAETAIALMDRFEFASILFPFNFVLYSRANFGPQVLEHARQKGMGILALKAMAKGVWPKEIKESERPQPKCWYQPAAMPEQAALALRWTLSQPVTAAVPPGDEKYFQHALNVAQTFEPITSEEEKTLMASAQGVEPIFHLGNA
jgi:aryl-alcohol dehydrogenase-like predicted oxidoreductase